MKRGRVDFHNALKECIVPECLGPREEGWILITLLRSVWS